ncbi:MAG: redoxin domain-containing protein [Ignavibacteria bacterium]|nr:redoxin domain-containing protein [Ignavibacteria bacterium]
MKSKIFVSILSVIIISVVCLAYAFSTKSNYELSSLKDVTGKWINSDKDISLSDLNGKVVLIEFWTFGCYNCKNTLPYVKDWYSKYKSDKFEVIGIHCPEFDRERKFENVRNAVEEFGIKYPVLVDNEFTIWDKFNVDAWPTIIILDKQGNVRYTKVGEGSYDKTEAKIKELVAEE